MKTKALSLFVLALLMIVSACTPTSSGGEQPTPIPEQQASPTIPVPTVVPTVITETPTSAPQCAFTISTPPGMYLTNEDPHSEIYAVFLENPEAGARNFVYVSMISPEIQNMVKAGTYQNEVYNYDPKIAETLLGMAVGENITLSDLRTGFTYERKPDTQISGYNAQAYENLQPWEFPVGTKEIRYYVSLDACMYQIGGYVDTTESDQPGSISEVLFNEIVATIQFVP